MNPLKQTHGKNGVPELPSYEEIANGVKGPFTRPDGPSDPKPIKWDCRPCSHPDHNPPSMICLKQGEVHCHTCPGCGRLSYLKIRETLYDPRRY
jgi:hypothetical protein